MIRKYKPYDFGIWLENIDVNSLSDLECAEISSVNIDDDIALDWLISSWIKPRYQKWDEKNQEGMRSVLIQTDQWSDAELRPVFDQIQFPSGQRIVDMRRFIRALKTRIL